MIVRRARKEYEKDTKFLCVLGPAFGIEGTKFKDCCASKAGMKIDDLACLLSFGRCDECGAARLTIAVVEDDDG